MDIISELSEPVELSSLTPSVKVMAQEKLSRGAVFFDIRMWKKWNQDLQFHPSKNGLFIERRDFDALRPKLEAFLDAHK